MQALKRQQDPSLELGKVIGANEANKMKLDQIQKNISNFGKNEKKNSFTNYKIQNAQLQTPKLNTPTTMISSKGLNIQHSNQSESGPNYKEKVHYDDV